MDSYLKFHTSMPAILSSQQLPFRNKQLVQMEQSPKSHHSPSGKLVPQKPSSTNKQPAQKDPVSKIQSFMSAYQVSEQMSMEPLPKVQSGMPPNLGAHQLSSKNKRKSRTEKLPKVQGINFANQVASSTNNKTAHVEPSPKVQNESFESVRSKLRESLAGALAFVSGEESKTQETSSTEGTSTQGPLIAISQVGELSSTAGSTPPHALSETPSESMISKADEHEVIQKYDGSCGLTGDAFVNEYAGDSTKLWNCCTRGFEMKHISLKENMPFNNKFVLKDELLQENGLYWASDISVENSKLNGGIDPKRRKFAQDEVTRDVRKRVDRTQILAANIEVELFRLFAGVNKKYKEKGRSLLFNLKDPNNPELRERVFLGEITPEHLCSMTAEELASKQLTEWRIAKAEELAQMVVLPDSDVDLRRLVKKTHKGEFQVEVERDDSVSVEVTLGANARIQVPTRTSKRKDSLKSANNGAQNLSGPSETGGGISEEVDSEVEHLSNPNTPSQDILEFMVNEQDAECLPPIVSFDVFMESLDSEPPFKNLSMDAEQHALTDKKSDRSDSKVDPMSNNSEHKLNATPVGSETKPNSKSDNFTSKLDHSSDGLVSKVNNVDAGSADPLDMPDYRPGEIDSKHEHKNSGHSLGSGAVHTELDKTSINVASLGEHIWEGLVQLNIFSLVTLLAFFKSGKKASAEEWPSFLEVKGRVRVDAFEKFLQELPLSRSRAIMAMDSYVADDRLGYAEPAPGVELYLCPPHHPKTIRMLGRFVQEEHMEALASTGDGLIGVVVWRRAHVTSKVSPRLTSQHKHSSSSKRHSISKKQRPNADHGSQPVVLARAQAPVLNPEPQVGEDVDDVPPGFGSVAATGNGDDLPEFHFQGRSLPAVTNIPTAVETAEAHPRGGTLARPAEHMRELIHKYGYGEAKGSPACHIQPPVQLWDEDDDDDDIPEWQPHQDNRLRWATAQPLPLQGFQQQSVSLRLANQHPIPAPPQPSTIGRGNVLARQPIPHEAPPPPLVMRPHFSVMQGSQYVQRGACWPGASAHLGLSANGMQRPCHYVGGRPVEGQCYGRQGFGDPQIVMDWGYVPRSRNV